MNVIRVPDPPSEQPPDRTAQALGCLVLLIVAVVAVLLFAASVWLIVTIGNAATCEGAT